MHADGGKYFGRALKNNLSLENLNLRLNRLGDEGGRLLLEGLLENFSLKQLNLSCNALEFDSAQTLSGILSSSSSPLNSLDLSGNMISEDAGRLLAAALSENRTLTHMDLRLNQVTKINKKNINTTSKAQLMFRSCFMTC